MLTSELKIAGTLAMCVMGVMLVVPEAQSWVHQRTTGYTPQLQLTGGVMVGEFSRVADAISAGADVNRPDRLGTTPLMSAAQAGNCDRVVARLLNAGAEFDARDVLGQTALMYAARSGNTQPLRALLCAGADVDLVDCRGRTAEDFAHEYGHEECALILARYRILPVWRSNDHAVSSKQAAW